MIAYDIQFTEPSASPAADNALIQAARRADGGGTDVVLATTEITSTGRTLIFGGGKGLEYSKATPANSNLTRDEDGTVRRVPWAIDQVGTLATVAAGLARGHTIERSEMPADPAWVDFAGGPGTVSTVSFTSVLDGEVPAAKFRDKVVVVGATARSLQDLQPTPTSPSMPGPELHANAIATALREFPLQETHEPIEVPVILVLTMAPALFALRFTRFRTALLSVALAGIYLVIAQVVFGMGRILPVALPLVGIAFSTLAVLVLGAAPRRATAR